LTDAGKVHIVLLLFKYKSYSNPIQMDNPPSSSRRKKSDKAKEKRERTPYSSQHVREAIAVSSRKAARNAKNK